MQHTRIRLFRFGLLCAFVILGASWHCNAQQPIPAPVQEKSVLITGATVHVGNGHSIDDGAVGFSNGKIDLVGYSYSVKTTYDTIINAKGKHVYPGFIAADATLGLEEIEAVRASVDQADIGEFEPELRTISAYKADSRIIPTVRANGILVAQIAPRGSVIGGTSSVVQLDAWDWEQAAYKMDDAVHLNWPNAYERRGWWAEPLDAEQKEQEKRQQKIDEIRIFFRAAKAYSQNGKPEKIDLRYEAMRGLFDGTRSLFVNADLVKEISEAVIFARDEGIKKTVIVGGYDAWHIADLLRENKVDVVLRRLHSLPLRPDDDVDLPYRLPALLKAGGVRFCLGYAGAMETMGLRNLPFLAGTAQAYGLSSEDALCAITRDAAAILGIDERCGTLAVGKDANLFISNGDALDMRTNALQAAFIQGREIDLDEHQQQLYRMYKDR